jgi:hypothetical protein
LPAETVPPVTPVAAAANAVAEEDPDQLDPQDSLAAPETPEPQEAQDSQADPNLLLASNLFSPHAAPAQEVNPEAPDLRDPQDNLELPDSPANPEETQLLAHQDPQDPQVSLDNQDTPEAPDSLVPQLQARTLLHHHQDPQESKDPQVNPDSLEDQDSPEAQDSLAPRDPQDHLEAQETMVNPDPQDNPASQDTPANQVSARNTAPWTEESSSPMVPDVLKRRTRRNSKSENKPGDNNNIKSYTNYFFFDHPFPIIIAVIRLFLSCRPIDQKLPFHNYKFIL